MDKNQQNQKRPNVETLTPVLTVSEVARWLRLSESKVYTMLADRCPGGIPVVRFGRSIRVRASDLRLWITAYPTSDTHRGGP